MYGCLYGYICMHNLRPPLADERRQHSDMLWTDSSDPSVQCLSLPSRQRGIATAESFGASDWARRSFPCILPPGSTILSARGSHFIHLVRAPASDSRGLPAVGRYDASGCVVCAAALRREIHL